MDDKVTISTFQLFQMFPDQESARKYLESKLWPNGVKFYGAKAAIAFQVPPSVPEVIQTLPGGVFADGAFFQVRSPAIQLPLTGGTVLRTRFTVGA